MKKNKWEQIRKVHPNSVSAYYDGLLNNSFSERESKIITALRVMKQGTDREISEFLGFSHKSAVQPRISELLDDAGLLEECGCAVDEETGKTVRVVRIIAKENADQLTLF